jgi:RNA polymerase sigma factor (sigma-70 family)
MPDAAVEWQQQVGVLSHEDRMRWLRRKLRDKLVDSLRRLKLQPINISCLGGNSMDHSSQMMAGIGQDPRSGPHRPIIREEDALRVAKMLKKPSSAQAEAIVLKYCEGLSVEEISRHMNKTPSAVGGHLRHGMSQLRELILRED